MLCVCVPIDPSTGRPDNSLPGGFPGRIDNSLPWGPGRPDQSLPWGPGRPNNDLPWGSGRPDQGLPPPIGTWPPRPVIWPPVPPITVDPGDEIDNSLPITLPGSPNNDLPPVVVKPGVPTNPIVLPPLPEGGGVVLALVMKLPGQPKDADGSQQGLLWYGPGTLPVLVTLPPPGAPK